eukprot:jgi/Tetstr1/462615/TSEL_007600.t1
MARRENCARCVLAVSATSPPRASEFCRKCGKSTTVDGLPVVREEALVSAVTEAMYDRMNGHGHHMELPTGYSVGLCTMGWSMHVTVVRDQEQIALLAPRATMASVSTFHAAAGTDDASWEDIMLPRGAREPPPVPRGPPLRYYLTTVSADDTSSVFDWSS